MSPPPVLSITGRRWALNQQPTPQQLRTHALHPLLARCLALRVGDADIADWLKPSLDHLHDPGLILGMDRAVDRLRRAVSAGERVRIVTDYDVDGTTSSLILQRALWTLGAREQVDYHIPDRFAEGYGFSPEAARKAAEDGVKLIVTADIGVRDHAAVDAAADAGVDVIICDHHLPAGESVPARAYAVLCPPQDGCPYPNKALAACGVSLKLTQALLADRPNVRGIVLSMLKIAAIGTVADVVDLANLENRAIVALGLEQLSQGPHAPGLQALLNVSGLSAERIDASDLGYRIAPRINAAGRLAGARTVIELFSAPTLQDALRIAGELDKLNTQRQEIEQEMVERCVGQIPSPPPAFVLLSGDEAEGWHRGVVGIVAARVRERVHRPVAVVSVSDGTARGSVRSTPGVHAVRALESAAELLEKFGGHPAAAGFSVRPEHIPALAERLARYAEESGADGAAPDLELDAACSPSDLDWSTIRALQKLGPHGKGNPRPLLWVRGVRPEGLRLFGKTEKHLRFRAGLLEAVWWNGAPYLDRLYQQTVDLAAEVEINHWQGRSTPRLCVQDVSVSSQGVAVPSTAIPGADGSIDRDLAQWGSTEDLPSLRGAGWRAS